MAAVQQFMTEQNLSRSLMVRTQSYLSMLWRVHRYTNNWTYNPLIINKNWWCTIKPLFSGYPLLNGHSPKPRKKFSLITVKLSCIISDPSRPPFPRSQRVMFNCLHPFYNCNGDFDMMCQLVQGYAVYALILFAFGTSRGKNSLRPICRRIDPSPPSFFSKKTVSYWTCCSAFACRSFGHLLRSPATQDSV